MAGTTEVKTNTAHEESNVVLHATSDLNQIEAPVTWKAYLICAFASFGGKFDRLVVR